MLGQSRDVAQNIPANPPGPPSLILIFEHLRTSVIPLSRGETGTYAEPAHIDDDALRTAGSEQRDAGLQLRPRRCARVHVVGGLASL